MAGKRHIEEEKENHAHLQFQSPLLALLQEAEHFLRQAELEVLTRREKVQ